MTDKKIIFITGATGFVGSAVARVLLDKGYHLRVLARRGSDRQNLEGLADITIVEGDLSDPRSYAHALEDCRGLFHVAADYRIWVPDVAAMNKINVEGTQNLMRAAMKAGIPRIVYTSSVATLGLNPDGTPADETTPSSLETMVGVYKKSKFLAEQAVLDMIRNEGLPCVIVNPSTPIGPRDVKPTPTGRILVEAMAGRMPAYVDTGLNIAHVDDVAMGHYLAFEKGQIGQKYILGGENMGLGDMLAVIAKILGRKPPKIALPLAPLYPLAFVAELVSRFTKREPFLTMDGLRMARKKMFFTAAKAQKELGYAPRPAEEAIKDALGWFRAKGYT